MSIICILWGVCVDNYSCYHFKTGLCHAWRNEIPIHYIWLESDSGPWREQVWMRLFKVLYTEMWQGNSPLPTEAPTAYSPSTSCLYRAKRWLTYSDITWEVRGASDVSLKSVGLGKLIRKASSEQEDKNPNERTERWADIRMENTVGTSHQFPCSWNHCIERSGTLVLEYCSTNGKAQVRLRRWISHTPIFSFTAVRDIQADESRLRSSGGTSATLGGGSLIDRLSIAYKKMFDHLFQVIWDPHHIVNFSARLGSGKSTALAWII